MFSCWSSSHICPAGHSGVRIQHTLIVICSLLRYNWPTLLSYLDRTVRPRAQLTSGPGSAVTLQAMVRLVCFSFGWCSRLSSTTETTGASRQHSQSQSAFVFLVCYMECVDMEEQNIIRNFQTNPSLDMAQFSQIREICQPASRITEGKF